MPVCRLLPGGVRKLHARAAARAGMTFEQLFRAARERFLVADVAALRSHLTEFADHDLAQTR